MNDPGIGSPASKSPVIRSGTNSENISHEICRLVFLGALLEMRRRLAMSPEVTLYLERNFGGSHTFLGRVIAHHAATARTDIEG